MADSRLPALAISLQTGPRAIETGLKERLSHNDPFLSDYEIEVVLDYYLREDDPAYRDDDDNILAKRCYSLKGVASDGDLWFDDGENHNVFEGWDGHPMKDEHHCWLFHDLYDHSYRDSSRLPWKDIMRIGTIWVDIQVWPTFRIPTP